MPVTVSDPTDEQLLSDAEQDPAAQQALIGAVWPRAYRVALGVLADPAGAEDVAQETCLKLLNGAQGYDRERPLRPWVLRVARNAALDRHRASTRRKAHERRAARAERVETALDPDVLAVREQLALLDDALRQTLALHYLEGLSQREAAHVLDCPAGTVASRVKRGLSQLKEALAPSVATTLASLLPIALVEPVPAAPLVDALQHASRAAATTRGATDVAQRTGRGALGALPLLASLAVVGVAGAGLAAALLTDASTPATASGSAGEDPGSTSHSTAGEAIPVGSPFAADTEAGGAVAGTERVGRTPPSVGVAGDADRATLALRATINAQPWTGAEIALGRHALPEPGEFVFQSAYQGPPLEARLATTDASGHAELGLEPGVWTLSVRAPRADLPAPNLERDDLRDPEQSVELVLLVCARLDEAWEDSFDEVLLVGERAQVQADLEDVVLIRGRVVNAQGEGMSGAWVWASEHSLDMFPEPMEPPAVAVRCDAEGAFSFPTEHMPGTLLGLGAGAPGHAPAACQVRGGSEPVTLTLTKGHRVEVVVLDPAGLPVSEATLRVSTNLPDARTGQPIHWEQEAVVGAEGLVLRLPSNSGPRHALLAAEATDAEGRFVFAQVMLGHDEGPHALAAALDDAGQPAAEAQGPDRLALRFPAPHPVHGLVVGPEGRPVPGARVYVVQGRTLLQDLLDQLAELQPAVLSDGGGRFELPDLQGRSPRLLVLADGMAPAWKLLDGGLQRVELAPPRSVDVRVRWPDRAPKVFGAVAAFQPDLAPLLGDTLDGPELFFPEALGIVATDEAGLGRLEGLPDAPVTCVVVQGRRVVHVQRLEPGATELELEVTTPQAATVSLRPVAAKSGEPLQATIRAFDADGRALVAPNFESFSMDSSACALHASGRVRLVLEVDGRPPLERWIDVEPGGSLGLGRVPVPSGNGTLRLRIRYPENDPVNAIILAGVDPVSGLPFQRQIDCGGGVSVRTLSGLTPGEYRFQIRTLTSGRSMRTDLPPLEVTVPDGALEVELDLRTAR